MNLLRNLLAEFGYGLAFRGDVWTECLAARGSELWVGRGHDEDDALTEIVRQMFPSALSRLLLAREQEPAQASRFGTSNGNGVAASSVRSALTSSASGAAAVNEAVPGSSANGIAADNTSNSVGMVQLASSSSVAAAVYNALAPGGSSARGTAGTGAADLTAASLSTALPASPSSTHAASTATARSMRTCAAALTDRGRRRLRNEDACLVVAERGLVAVADGLGAYARGDVASTMAIEVLRKAFQDAALSPARSKGLPMLLAASFIAAPRSACTVSEPGTMLVARAPGSAPTRRG